MAVYYRCPLCKSEHLLMLMQTGSQASLEAMTYEGNSEKCPVTGRQVVLDKSHLLWKDEADKKR